MTCGGENGTSGSHLAVFSEDVAFACHFVATCLPPTLPPYRSASDISYVSKKLSKMMRNPNSLCHIISIVISCGLGHTCRQTDRQTDTHTHTHTHTHTCTRTHAYWRSTQDQFKETRRVPGFGQHTPGLQSASQHSYNTAVEQSHIVKTVPDYLYYDSDF